MDIKAICQEFPILTQKKKNYPLVHFDNAATTHIPKKILYGY